VIALVGVTAAWGSTFFMLKGVVTRVPAADFLAVRFAVAGLALWALAPRSMSRLTPTARRHGILLGTAYGVGQLLQTWGLEHTSASVSGFVTGMYVIITPLLGAVPLRQRVLPVTWVAVGLATAGLGVLSVHGFALGAGESLTLVSAAVYAAHIVGLGAWSTGRDAFGLTVMQMLTVAVVCSAAALPGGVTLPSTTPDWSALLYMALVAGAAALLLQTWAQAHLPATRAAIVMTMEPLWAGGFAVTLGSEPVGARLLVGGTLALSAMFLAELGPRFGGRFGARFGGRLGERAGSDQPGRAGETASAVAAPPAAAAADVAAADVAAADVAAADVAAADVAAADGTTSSA
jgi:drug/metabolite transporter (DMT)-like permease